MIEILDVVGKGLLIAFFVWMIVVVFVYGGREETSSIRRGEEYGVWDAGGTWNAEAAGDRGGLGETDGERTDGPN